MLAIRATCAVNFWRSFKLPPMKHNAAAGHCPGGSDSEPGKLGIDELVVVQLALIQLDRTSIISIPRGIQRFPHEDHSFG